MDNTDNAVIGEPMSAPVNSYGDATSIDFPRTGLHMYLSTATHQLGNSNDVSEFASVDVPAPFTFADYAAERDPAIDPILRGEEMRSLPVIAVADGGSAARRVHEDRMVRFRDYTWWSPPAEIALRRAGQKLLALKRFQDAIETDQLNAEIHPDIWNVWYNLGKAQMAAGFTRDALESYRRVLQIDPNNDNAEEIRKAFVDAGIVLN
jgi:tetratricopeptide (TPR) repeat protein